MVVREVKKCQQKWVRLGEPGCIFNQGAFF